MLWFYDLKYIKATTNGNLVALNTFLFFAHNEGISFSCLLKKNTVEEKPINKEIAVRKSQKKQKENLVESQLGRQSKDVVNYFRKRSISFICHGSEYASRVKDHGKSLKKAQFFLMKQGLQCILFSFMPSFLLVIKCGSKWKWCWR